MNSLLKNWTRISQIFQRETKTRRLSQLIYKNEEYLAN